MVKDSDRSLQDLKDHVQEHCEERDWCQFHNPKDLAIGLSIETSEILEIFRFKSVEEIEEMFIDEIKREEIEDEVADVLFFLMRFAQKFDIDLADAFDRKSKKSKEKYPVEKCKGLNKKYTEYE
jgi:NTP pyrophosphatase (non-canonical NTP hydrolase)